jgi:nicotinate (nicotinamide) nucleotide adenylyltransferase
MVETTDRRRLVVLTGSFNPPTLAHLDLLKKAMAAAGAERGLFLPANDEYVRRKMAKTNESVVIGEEARISMLEAMCRGESSLGISRVDIGAARTCTYESLLRVSKQNPGYDVLLVIGADKIKIVPKWLRVKELLRDFKFVISRRGGDSVEDLIAASPISAALSAAAAATFEIDGGVADMSSSEVRRKFVAGEDYAALLHPAAAEVLSRYTPGDFPRLDFASWARIILSTGRFGEGKVNKRVYEMNRDLFLAWARGEDVDVPGGLGERQRLLEGTRVYSSALDASAVPVCGADTRFGCANEDCVEVARELLGEGFNPAILNLASRRHACGGYDSGLGAQEEYLCRSSTLSQSLYQYFKPTLKCVRESGVPQKVNAYPLDISFGGIYSPGVRFFRAGKDRMFAYREQPFDCAVITVAALSFREPNSYCNEERQYMAEDGGFTPEGDAIQLNKIRTICRIALLNGHDSVVLGAFGCGVNKLPSGAVADQFRRVFDEPEFKGKFRAVVIAIREGRGSARRPVEKNGKFAPFYATFGRWTK